MTIAIVLAAGKGTRMHSRLPKVAHQVGGRPMIAHVHLAITGLADTRPLYVLGHEHEAVRGLLPADVEVVLQQEQLGTGHAVRVALESVPADTAEALILYGDMPLITDRTLATLLQRHREHGCHLTLLSAHLPDPRGYGRVLRDGDGIPRAIVEDKWLSPDQQAITEVNTGVYAVDVAWLRGALADLPAHPDGEYYLTDIFAQAAAVGSARVVSAASPDEALGINDRRQLARAEELLRRRTNGALMDAGVTLLDPATAYIAADASIGPDTVVEPNVYIGTGVTIGSGCHIGANSRIVASSLGDRCHILASVIEYSELADDVEVGPFSHLRPGAMLARGVHVGNFAEIKNSSIGPDSKMGHVSYVGDSIVGEQVNIGAGAVTVNFDGRAKYRTTIGDGAFIGSGTMLRAPITLGAGSVTGAGSVVTRDVPAGVTVFGVPARPRPEAGATPSPAPEAE